MNQKYVLKKNEDIEKLVANKISVGSKYYAIYYKKTELDIPKVAISVSKKCGSSPKRNYEKRVIREIIRNNYFDSLCGYECLVVVKKESTSLEFDLKNKELGYVISKMIKKG